MVYDKTFFDTYGLAIIIAILIVLSIVAFFLTGFIFVSKQRVAVIEKVGNYIGTYDSGLYYFFPLLYKRAGYYKKGITEQKLKIENETYIVKYQIENYKQWHYVGNHDSFGIVRSSLLRKDEDLSKLLIERFNLAGAKFITLEKMKK